MKTNFSTTELELADELKKQWLDLAYNKCGDGINKPIFEKNINWIYNHFLNLENPTVVYCDSIIEAMIKITMTKDFNLELIEYPKYYNLYMTNDLSTAFIDAMKENSFLKYSYIGWSNFGWVAFYDFFTKIGVLNNEIFNRYIETVKTNVFETFEFEFAVFAVQPPEYIISNNNIPHSINEPAVKFKDGSTHAYINGVLIPNELFDKLINNEYTFKEFITEENEEFKATVLFFLEEKFGTVGVFDFIRENLQEVDTYVDIKKVEYLEGTTKSEKIGVYTLFKGLVNNLQIAYVRCFCPSTDRMFFLGVKPNESNAKDAIASLYRVPTIIKDNIVSLSRQGEKFSTIFDDETIKKLENNEFTKKELSSYSTITGNQYFEYITYEF